MQSNFPLSRAHQPLLFAGVFAGIFWGIFAALYWRASGHWPTWFGDECTHGLTALHQGTWSRLMFAPVFNSIYGATRACEDGFLECARGLNALFYAATLFPLYGLARRFTSRYWALGLACLGVLGPHSIYTAFFAPEPLYFLGVWSLIWLMLRSAELSNIRAVTLGLGLCALSTIKFHGVFLLPGVVAFHFWQSWTSSANAEAIRHGLRFCAWLLTSFFVSRTILVAQAAGTWNPMFTGDFYQLNTTGLERPEALTFVILVAMIGLAHLVHLFLLIGLPAWLLSGNVRQFSPANTSLIAAFFFLSPPILAVTLAFSASLGNWDEVLQGVTLLHARYYNFLWPFFCLILGSSLATKTSWTPATRRGVFIFLAALVISATHLRHTGLALATEAPEFYTLTIKSLSFQVLLALTVTLAVLALRSSRQAALGYLVLFLPLYFVNGWYFLSKHLIAESHAGPAEQAGLIARQILRTHHANSEVLIWSRNPFVAARAALQLNLPHAHTNFFRKPGYDPFISEHGTRYDWLLSLDDKVRDPRWILHLERRGLQLYRHQDTRP